MILSDGKIRAFSEAVANEARKKRIQTVLKIQNDTSLCICQNANFRLSRFPFLCSLPLLLLPHQKLPDLLPVSYHPNQISQLENCSLIHRNQFTLPFKGYDETIISFS